MESVDLEVFEDPNDNAAAYIVGDLAALKRLGDAIAELTANPNRFASVGIPTKRGELRIELKDSPH